MWGTGKEAFHYDERAQIKLSLCMEKANNANREKGRRKLEEVIGLVKLS